MKFLYFFLILFTVIVNSQTVIYQGSNSIINNPERGFYHYTSTGSNGGYNLLFAESTAVELTSAGTPLVVDILSNGFKIKSNNSNYNGSLGSYIYAAFAEHPFKNSLAR